MAEWLRRGLQILVFKHFYLSSHSKVPVKESIILKFILQVISWSIPGQFWGGSQTSLITHSQSQDPTVLHCSFVRLCLRPRVLVLVVRLRFKVGPICVSVFTRVQEFNFPLPRKEYITPLVVIQHG